MKVSVVYRHTYTHDYKRSESWVYLEGVYDNPRRALEVALDHNVSYIENYELNFKAEGLEPLYVQQFRSYRGQSRDRLTVGELSRFYEATVSIIENQDAESGSLRPDLDICYVQEVPVKHT